MEKAQESMAQWPTFIQQYDLDPEIGILIRPTHKVTAFNYDKLKLYVEYMMSLSKAEEIEAAIANFPDLEIK